VVFAERWPLLEVRLYYIEQFKLASAKHEKTTGVNNCLMKSLSYHQSGEKQVNKSLLLRFTTSCRIVDKNTPLLQ